MIAEVLLEVQLIFVFLYPATSKTDMGPSKGPTNSTDRDPARGSALVLPRGSTEVGYSIFCCPSLWKGIRHTHARQTIHINNWAKLK